MTNIHTLDLHWNNVITDEGIKNLTNIQSLNSRKYKDNR